MAHNTRDQGGHNDGLQAPLMPRRVELLAATSLAIDLGLGQPLEHMLRSCTLGMRLTEQLGLGREHRDRVFYATLLAWIGCHADSPELAAVFGDDIGFRAATYRVDMHGAALMGLMLRKVASGKPPLVRGVRTAAFLVTGRSTLHDVIVSHCVSAGALAGRLGVDDEVGRLLGFTFERWDGAGLPNGAHGPEIPVEMRIVHLCDTAETYLRDGGPEAAMKMVRQRRGTHFDPEIADAFCDSAPELCRGLAEEDAWSTALASAPEDQVLDDSELDRVLTAMGDFADLKSPFTIGHSRAVAALAEAAGQNAGLPAAEQRRLRLAGLVHDLGRMGVSNAIWDKTTPLTTAEQERVHLHPYLTERILGRVPALRPIAALAGAHHERLDGSGYSRGVSAEGLGVTSRILAAADSYRASTEPRPHREPSSMAEAAARLRNEVVALRLDGSAVEAVLDAAGHRRSRRPAGPAGLTSREVDVLRLIVRGFSSRQIAADLVISEKTARNHLEHIYAKLAVTNRTGAALFALQHGIVGNVDDASALP
ncbi:HD domain-containing phosphohydrolase [Glaciibacter superstes]|uniref:HD domain-containing phosphohydrolase n=1 Tax=Glaciibacter superstes TaxID=501023 RepID=UPI0003B6D34F|nr:HD domain-containing phosphohydrolase [Glaciibacter superstes]